MSLLARKAQRRRILHTLHLIDTFRTELLQTQAAIPTTANTAMATATITAITEEYEHADRCGTRIREGRTIRARSCIRLPPEAHRVGLRPTDSEKTSSAPEHLQALRCSPSRNPRLFSKASSGLSHFQSKSTMPKHDFEGPASANLALLDKLSQSLCAMVHAIDESIAAMTQTASEAFDRHTASGNHPSDSARSARHYGGEEGWQTGSGKKTVWDPNADWGSDMAWVEIEVAPMDKDRPGPGSKLRYNYVPYEWSTPAAESAESKAEDTYSSWW